MQWSHRTLGDPVFVILRDKPHFNPRIDPSAACCHGEYGSVCLAWQSAALSFLLKLPRVCSFNRQVPWSGERHPDGITEINSVALCGQRMS